MTFEEFRNLYYGACLAALFVWNVYLHAKLIKLRDKE